VIGSGLYGFPSQSYWLDIGTPARYLQGTFDILEGKSVRRWVSAWVRATCPCPRMRRLRGRAIPPAVIESGASVAEGAHVGSLVVLGHDVTVGAGSTVERAVILNGTEIGENCTLRDCIVAPGVASAPALTSRRAPCSGRGSPWGRNVIAAARVSSLV